VAPKIWFFRKNHEKSEENLKKVEEPIAKSQSALISGEKYPLRKSQQPTANSQKPTAHSVIYTRFKLHRKHTGPIDFQHIAERSSCSPLCRSSKTGCIGFGSHCWRVGIYYFRG
jgi:hypothetical protein